jgi:ABC-2 type transport system ATP-binding protein
VEVAGSIPVGVTTGCALQMVHTISVGRVVIYERKHPQMIDARGLYKQFGDVVAVQDLDIHVQAGSVYALLGPNGAGKSTTINMLTTLLQPDRGQITIAGLSIPQNAATIRRMIGVTFQDLVLDRDLTGRESLDFHGRLYGLDSQTRRTRIHELLELVELSGAADRLTGTYSGGMRRRLELARCLMMHPQILFLDEPTQGLDPQHRAMIWEYLRTLQRTRGMTVVITTHAMDEAELLADYVGIIDHGRMVTHGTVNALISQFGDDIVRMRMPTFPTVTWDVYPWVTQAHWVNQELLVGVDNGARRLPELLDIVRSHGAQVIEVTMQRPHLGDVFLRTTGRALRDEVTQ